MEPSWERGTCIFKNGLGHVTKMAIISIYGQSLYNLLLWNQKLNDLETRHQRFKVYRVNINNDRSLTLPYLTPRCGSNCLLEDKFFIWGRISSDIRSEILFYDDASAEP